MPDAAVILHADADSFFASVEQRDDPALRDRPLIVGPGVVLAASYEAKALGVRSGMGVKRARALCPEAVVVPPRFSAYTAASKELFALFQKMAPVVEGLSMEEAFLDVSGLGHISGTPLQIAQRLHSDAWADVGLPVSVGVARTKVLAKMASRAAKPDGVLRIAPEAELDFLHPLPIEALWGVGPATKEKLHALGVLTIGDAASLDAGSLAEALGRRAGQHVHDLARNRDLRRVRKTRGRRSFGSQSALGRATRSRAELDKTLMALAERVTRRMRKSGRSGRTIVLRLRFGDYAKATRSLTLPHPTAVAATVLAATRRLLDAAWPDVTRRGLTLIGIAVTNLGDDRNDQLALPLDRPDRQLERAVDALRDRFGSDSIKRAALMRSDPRLDPWLRPGDEE